MKKQNLKEQNIITNYTSSSLIEMCNDTCQNLKTYFLLPFIALNSTRIHYYTAVHILDEHRLNNLNITIENIMINLLHLTKYESLLYIKLVNKPVTLNAFHGDKYIYLEVNILDFFGSNVFINIYNTIYNQNILKNRQEGNTCLIIEFEGIYPQIIRQLLASQFGIKLSGGSNSGKELLTIQHYALTRFLEFKYAGSVPTILKNSISIGNKLRAHYGKFLHLDDIIEYDTFKEYIINKYIDIPQNTDHFDSGMNQSEGDETNVKNPINPSTEISTSSQNSRDLRSNCDSTPTSNDTTSCINSDINSTPIDNLNIPTLSNRSPQIQSICDVPRMENKHQNSISVKPIEFKVEYHTKSKLSNVKGKGKYLLYKSRNFNTKAHATILESIPPIFNKLEIILRENPKNSDTQIKIEKFLQKQGEITIENVRNR
jgi:hypothetical protein